MWTKYQDGYFGFFRPERAGVFYDKFHALWALAIRDWRLSFTIDERYFINFYDLFQTEMTELFGGIILQDATQLRDGVGQSLLNHDRVPPDRGEELLSADDPARAGSQADQDVHDTRLDLLPVGSANEQVPIRMDLPFAEPEGRPFSRRLRERRPGRCAVVTWRWHTAV